jgi:hypothetical protein
MRVESFKISGWEDEETGLIVDENGEWIFVKHIPADYVIDGYTLYNKKHIEERIHSEVEEQIEKVLKLKGVKKDRPSGFQLMDTVSTLKWLEETYGLFEFQDNDQNELFYGQINRVINNYILIIDMIKTSGEVEVEYDYEFEIEEIRAITFESDYFNSIKLLYEDQKK